MASSTIMIITVTPDIHRHLGSVSSGCLALATTIITTAESVAVSTETGQGTTDTADISTLSKYKNHKNISYESFVQHNIP